MSIPDPARDALAAFAADPIGFAPGKVVEGEVISVEVHEEEVLGRTGIYSVTPGKCCATNGKAPCHRWLMARGERRAEDGKVVKWEYLLTVGFADKWDVQFKVEIWDGPKPVAILGQNQRGEFEWVETGLNGTVYAEVPPHWFAYFEPGYLRWGDEINEQNELLESWDKFDETGVDEFGRLLR